jgi:hypothetical protein
MHQDKLPAATHITVIVAHEGSTYQVHMKPRLSGKIALDTSEWVQIGDHGSFEYVEEHDRPALRQVILAAARHALIHAANRMA